MDIPDVPSTDALPPVIIAEAPTDAPVGEMTEAEMLREIVRNSRETRDNTRAMLEAVNKIVEQVSESLGNPMIGGMLKMFSRGK